MKEKNKTKSKIFNKITPLGDRVLVEPIETDSSDTHKKTSSGIFIPEGIDKEKREEGRVVAVGKGRYDDGELIPVGVKVGDKVIYSKYGYDEVRMDGRKLLILKEENILAIIK